MPTFRKDPLSERWVVFAEGRDERPNEFERNGHRRPDARCPFCAGHEVDTPPQITAYSSTAPASHASGDNCEWIVRVVPNKYPAFQPQGSCSPVGQGLYVGCAAVGTHEVIVESPRHVASLSELNDVELTLMMRAYRDRMVAIQQQSTQLRYALVFKNVGPEAGASLEHSHSQLVATPMVPHEVEREILAARRLYRQHGRCFFCQVLEQELEERHRFVAETEHFVAVCPYASRMPYEMWILAREHASHFECQADDLLTELAVFLQQLIRRLESVHGRLAYNYFIHTAPFDTSPLRHYHWHIEIFPRLTTPAGFEWGAGYYINPVPPERAAAILRS